MHRSSWEEMTKGIPQGSCLGPLLFNIFINDLFLFISQSTLINYADDNTLSKFHESIHLVIHSLSSDTKNAIDWFTNNFMKANPEKFQAMLMKPMSNQYQLPDEIQINGTSLKRESNVKLLGLIIDNKLKFDQHCENLCARASKQLNVLYLSLIHI